MSAALKSTTDFTPDSNRTDRALNGVYAGQCPDCPVWSKKTFSVPFVPGMVILGGVFCGPFYQNFGVFVR